MNEKKVSLETRLVRHPHLKSRIEALLDIAENTFENLELADAAEEQLIIEIQKTGQEVLQAWAKGQEAKKSEETRSSSKKVVAHSKKNFTGNQHSGK